MTPISFALEILLDCTTIEQAHKRARKYIKACEEKNPQIAPPRATYAQQAPSTQRILAEMAAEGSATPMPPIAPPPAAALPRINGGLVDNGDGTKGRKKW